MDSEIYLFGNICVYNDVFFKYKWLEMYMGNYLVLYYDLEYVKL